MALNENKITRHPVSSLCALCVSSQAFETSFSSQCWKKWKCSFPQKLFFFKIAVITRNVEEGRLMLLDN